jgi:hypothetical protein
VIRTTIDEVGRVIDRDVLLALRAEYRTDASFTFAFARQKSEAVMRLVDRCRELFDAPPPHEFLRLLETIGAFRTSYRHTDERITADVFLPVAAVMELLENRAQLGESEEERTFLPFYRFGPPQSFDHYDHFAFDMAAEVPAVVALTYDGPRPVAPTFTAWLKLLRKHSLHAADVSNAGESELLGPRFGSANAVRAWWSANRQWVRELYAST